MAYDQTVVCSNTRYKTTAHPSFHRERENVPWQTTGRETSQQRPTQPPSFSPLNPYNFKAFTRKPPTSKSKPAPKHLHLRPSPYKKPLVNELFRAGTSNFTSPFTLPGATELPLLERLPPTSLRAASVVLLLTLSRSARETAPMRSSSRSNRRFFSRSSRSSRSARLEAS